MYIDHGTGLTVHLPINTVWYVPVLTELVITQFAILTTDLFTITTDLELQ